MDQAGLLRERQYRYKENDPDYKGEECDSRLENGPIEERGCTDPLFCLLWIAFIVGVVLISLSAYQKGDPIRLAHGADYDGTVCGYGAAKDYPIIYFGYPLPINGAYKESLGLTVCVKSCPTSFVPQPLECLPNSNFDDKGCSVVEPTSADTKKLHYYPTTNFYNLYCLPTNGVTDSFLTALKQALQFGFITDGLQALTKAWLSLVYVAIAAVVISALYMILIRCCAKVLVWTIIISLIGGLVLLGFFLMDQSGKTPADGTNKASVLEKLAYLSWAFAGLLLIAAGCMLMKIQFVGEVLQAAAEFVGSESCTLLFPPLIFVIAIVFLIYWFVTLLYLWTSGTRTTEKGQMPFDGIIWNQGLRNLIYYHGFSLLWNMSFLASFLQFVLAGTAVFWYFKRKSFLGVGTFAKSFAITVRYHLGTILFGSLIITLIRVIRIIFAYLQYQIRQKTIVDVTGFLSYFVRCCECVVDCFERFLQYINTHAYIETILTGKSFCTAAEEGFYLMRRNIIEFGLAAGLGSAFIYVGKLLITVGGSIIGYILLTKSPFFADMVNGNVAFLMICFAIISYIIAAIFLEVWGIGADTILHCFLVDSEVHRTRGGAKHCPSGFRGFVENQRASQS